MNAWTRDTAIAAGQTWIAAHDGALPKTRQLCAGEGLPSNTVVHTLFGALTAFHAACLGAPPPTVRKSRPCLKCDGLFFPTHRGNHICGLCKTSGDWREPDDTDWLNPVSTLREVLHGVGGRR